jgi:hypothetical protein
MTVPVWQLKLMPSCSHCTTDLADANIELQLAAMSRASAAIKDQVSTVSLPLPEVLAARWDCSAPGLPAATTTATITTTNNQQKFHVINQGSEY